MFKSVLLSTVAIVALMGGDAEARIRGGGAAPVTAPVLTNTTVTFGQTTPAARGYVLLDAMDQTIPAYQPQTVSGLGLMSPSGPACDTWTSFTFVSNTASRPGTDFTVIAANTPDGGSAVTPYISATGAGHIAGDYIWHARCSKGGNLSNIATFTYHTVANEVTVGQFDNLTFGWAPTNFGSTPGAVIALATGSDFHLLRTLLRGVTLGGTVTNPVTLTVADTGRYPYVSNFEIQSLPNVTMQDIVATGNTDITGVNIIFGTSSTSSASGVRLNNLRYYGSIYFSPKSTGQSGQAAFGISGCTSTCEITNNVSDFALAGLTVQDNLLIQGNQISHFSSNCFGAVSMSTGATVLDNVCSDTVTNTLGQHGDTFQILDGATPDNLNLWAFWAIQAGSGVETQGPIFGGSPLNTTGYFNNSGTTLQITGSQGCLSGSAGSHIWSPGNIAVTDNVRLGCSAGAKVNIPVTGLATNIGSVGSPVAIYSVNEYNLNADGVINTNATAHGMTSPGESGAASINHFAYIAQVPNPAATNYFTATVDSATQLTVTVAPTVSDPGTLEPSIFGDITYTGCAACIAITGQLTSTESPIGQATGSVTGTVLTTTAQLSGDLSYNLATGSSLGGAMLDGVGVSPSTQIFAITSGVGTGPATYKVCKTETYTATHCDAPGDVGSVTITGRPPQQRGTYFIGFGTVPASPAGPFPMSATFYQNFGSAIANFAQVNSTCNVGNHTGSFAISDGYANGGFGLCGAPVVNTTTSNIVTPVAADYATGVLPSTTLFNIGQTAWNAKTMAQKRAATCNAMLPKVGGALDLGGGNFVGPFTATGEVQMASGNVAVTGCGIH